MQCLERTGCTAFSCLGHLPWRGKSCPPDSTVIKRAAQAFSADPGGFPASLRNFRKPERAALCGLGRALRRFESCPTRSPHLPHSRTTPGQSFTSSRATHNSALITSRSSVVSCSPSLGYHNVYRQGRNTLGVLIPLRDGTPRQRGMAYSADFRG
jgi:hypothetical protein